LSREGAKYNINVNVVAPSAGTNMTRTVWPEADVLAMKPDFVAPLIAVLCSDKCPTPLGGLYEAGTGSFKATRWQRARGVDFPHHEGIPPPEKVQAVSSRPLKCFVTDTHVNKVMNKICDFDDGQADHPDTAAEFSKYSMENVARSMPDKTLNRRRDPKL
jgi:multifunctional beta-oxidation protein